MVNVTDSAAVNETHRATTLGERLIREARDERPAVSQGRLDEDTVSLSADGQKAINLARGSQLAKEAKSAGSPEALVRILDDGIADVRRIGTLFINVIKGLFARARF